MELNELCHRMKEWKASDLFLKPEARPSIRVDGELRSASDDPINSQELEGFVVQALTPRLKQILDDQGEVDFAYDVEGVGRFRGNIYRQRGLFAIVFRLINEEIPDFFTLALPADQMQRLSLLHRGLVLVTGIAGSGKSTTLAAMIQYMNQHLNRHVVSIEDPIEYVFKDQQCVISQREVGLDTGSFASALKHCLRQSPDVIMIGEMRDRETMDAAITAAETGHLVLSTLHTINAVQTVERIITVFPTHQHALIRMQLSLILMGVISQRLLPRQDGPGRVPAVELLFATPTLKEILLEGKTPEIPKALKEGSNYYGTCTFNQSLKSLYEKELISLDTALGAADNPDELKLEIRGITRDAAPGGGGSGWAR